MDKSTMIDYRKNLKANCSNCFGLCCTALNIMASSDFAINKPAGVPCPNLQEDYRCQIHNELRDTGFKGCTVFDCLGAGQKISQGTFKGHSWREQPTLAAKMFRAFPVMEQLYEMMAYVSEILSYPLPTHLQKKLASQFKKLEELINLSAEELISLDMMMIRFPINELLLEASKSIREELLSTLSMKNKKIECRGVDWSGRNFANQDLRATNLRGALLIGVNFENADLRGVDFIGADLRDANLAGANLSTSMFLTQMQMNSAKGNDETKLPFYIERPAHWN